MINPDDIQFVTKPVEDRPYLVDIVGTLRLQHGVTMVRESATAQAVMNEVKHQIKRSVWYQCYGELLPVLGDLHCQLARHVHPMHLDQIQPLMDRLLSMVEYPGTEVTGNSLSLPDGHPDGRDIPAHIKAAAVMIDHWFQRHGISHYELGPVRSRNFSSSKATNTAAPRSEEGQKQDVGPSDKTSARDESQTSSNGAASAPSPCVTTAMPPDGPAESSPGHGRIPIDIVAAAEEH